VSLAPLLWMLSVSFMPAGRAPTRLPPPLLPDVADAAELSRGVPAPGRVAATSLNSFGVVAIAVTAHRRCTLNTHGRVRVRQAAVFAGRDRIFKRPARARS
jgi:multiple sugar transport system permease protein